MHLAEFEADAQRQGYELTEAEIGPDLDREAHAHDFDVRFLVIDGAFTLTIAGEERTYRPGDQCSVPAGTMHAEHTGPGGARFVVGTRPEAPQP